MFDNFEFFKAAYDELSTFIIEIFSLVWYERSLVFIDFRSVEIFEIGREIKLSEKKENSVKKAIFWQCRASQYTEKKIFYRMQMNFYVKFLDNCYEKIRKSELPKMVIFGRKPKPLSHLRFSPDLKYFNGSETYESCVTSVHN